MAFEHIITLILEAARRKPGPDFVSNLYAVKLEVIEELRVIMEQHREMERGEK